MLRRVADRQGLALRNSRLRGPTHVDDRGGWRIIDLERTAVVAGERFDLSLDDVESFLMADE